MPLPQAPTPATASLRAPSLRRRMACWLYEGVLLFGVVMLAGLVFGMATNTRHALQHRHGLQLVIFLLLALYFSYFWHQGRTLPMQTWRMRIVDRTGARLGWGRALARYLLAWLWFLPPLAVMAPLDLGKGEITAIMLGWIVAWALLSRLHPQRQFLHDAWAGTRIVDAPPPPKR